MEKPKLLYFSASESELDLTLERLCLKYGIAAINVKKEAYTLPIAAIAAGLPAVKNYAGEPLPEDMIVLSGFSEGSLELLLSEMKKYRTGVGVIKAVLTKYNASWTPIELFSELCRERSEIKKNGR